MRTLSTPPTPAAAKAEYAMATLRTAAVLADPSASPMDRYRAAEAEMAAGLAAGDVEPEFEAAL